MISVDIKGLQEAQQANQRALAAVSTDGGLGEAVKVGTLAAQRFGIAETHVLTGSLRASHRVELSGARGRVFLDPNAVNPRTGQQPSRYGIYEHARGGSHAFYANTAQQHGDSVAREAQAVLMRRLR